MKKLLYVAAFTLVLCGALSTFQGKESATPNGKLPPPVRWMSHAF
ncbi:MAG: hypothetical protein ACRCWQ_05735 [Bacilli bacterium]